MEPTLKQAKQNARRAREQRNATTNNEDFDLWHRVMEQWERTVQELTLKTGENK